MENQSYMSDTQLKTTDWILVVVADEENESLITSHQKNCMSSLDMSGKGNKMFELRIIQRRAYSEKDLFFYFTSEDVEEMFNLIEMMVKASRHETEYAIRVIEEEEMENEE